MKQYQLVGQITAVKGKAEELKNYLLEASELLKNHSDCIQYIVGIDEKEPNVVYVTEIWSSKEAHATSLEDEAIRSLILRARPIIASMSSVKELSVVGGKGVA